jgi:hypothetical protein
LLKFADTDISNLGQILKNFFYSKSPGNVGNFFCEQPRPIICHKWSRFKPICYFIKIHKFAQICRYRQQQFRSNFEELIFPPNHQEILGTFSVNSLDRLSATNGQDLSLYMLLYKNP